MINFEKDNVLEMFEDFVCGYNNEFTYCGAGASKVVFSFYEESTKQKYVVKVEKEIWGIDLITNNIIDEDEAQCDWDDEEYESCQNSSYEYNPFSYCPEDKCYMQTKKEIRAYEQFVDFGCDEFIAPILLEHSNYDRAFAVMPCCEMVCDEKYLLGEDQETLVKKMFNKLYKTHDDYCFLRSYKYWAYYGFVRNKLQEGKSLSHAVYEVIKQLALMSKLNEALDDISCGNVGLYNNKFVFIDYGYGC